MRKPGSLIISAEYHVTAKNNRGEFALEPKEIKEMFLQTVKRVKAKYSFKLKSFVLMDNHEEILFTLRDWMFFYIISQHIAENLITY